MRLPRPALADEHDRFGPLEVAARGQRLDPGRRDRRRPAEVELLERLDPWQVAVLEPTGDRIPLALLQLGLQESVEVAQVAVMLTLGLLGQPGALPGDGGQVELLAALLDDGLGQRRRRAHRATPVLMGASSRSYSPTAGRGRSNRTSAPTSTVSGRPRASCCAVTRCRTAAASVQPSTSAASIARCSASCPWTRPSWSSSIIALVP